MGFFKNIGKSVKGLTKMVSLKNVVKVATGNVSGLGKEAVGRVLKAHMGKEAVKHVQEGQVGQMADMYVTRTSDQVSNALIKTAAGSDLGQGAAKFLTKLWFQTMWAKYKWWIIGVAVVLVGLIWYLVKGRHGKTHKRY
jgi:hypothetical protein